MRSATATSHSYRSGAPDDSAGNSPDENARDQAANREGRRERDRSLTDRTWGRYLLRKNG